MPATVIDGKALAAATKAEAAEYPCETCESAEKKKAKTAEPAPAPAPAPVTKSGRIDHTACDHEKTASARKKCRDANKS